MNELGGYEWVYYQNLRAKRGFAKQKKELVAQLRETESILNYYLIRDKKDLIENTRTEIFQLCKKLEEVCQ